MQRLELRQNFLQALRQEQIMAPQQIQALEILLATVPELEQKITSELESNPTLELVRTGSEALIGNPVEPTDSEGAAGTNGNKEGNEGFGRDEALATLLELTKTWADYSASSRGGGGQHTPEDAERRQYLFDSLVSEPSLQEILMSQLREAEGLDEKMRSICEQIVGSIDETGYLRAHPSDLAIITNADLAEVKRAIAVVQDFDPAGIGARDLRECLLLQLDRQDRRGEVIYELVDKYLEDLGRNQIPRIARALRVSKNHLYVLLEEIKRLNPYPGSLVAPSRPNFVYPEVYIEKDGNGNWVVRPNRDYVPRLRVSPYYVKLLKDPNTPKEAKAYIREKVAGSKLLLRAIDQRQSTIERIAHSLLRFQRGFFDNGVAHMRPLIMSQVAEDIGVHETTVSRAIANKYVQTPHGLVPFKHFFSSGYEGSSGEMVSSHSIKHKLEEIVNNEDPKKPYSDQKLAQMLKDLGFTVARRTVAKYREELDILPSNMRRNY